MLTEFNNFPHIGLWIKTNFSLINISKIISQKEESVFSKLYWQNAEIRKIIFVLRAKTKINNLHITAQCCFLFTFRFPFSDIYYAYFWVFFFFLFDLIVLVTRNFFNARAINFCSFSAFFSFYQVWVTHCWWYKTTTSTTLWRETKQLAHKSRVFVS